MSREKMQTAEECKEDNDRSSSSEKTLKRKVQSEKQNTVISQFTICNPDWSYLHLKLVTTASLQASIDSTKKTKAASIDEVTAYLHLQSALERFLGVHGTAIPLDILKVDGNEVWVRAPKQDADAVVAAAGGWVGGGGEGWRVIDWGCWGPSEGEDGRDLFG
ncbi:hypothetical protein C1H76_8360 [Elsinoe australis]|uniref:Ribonucleases P/MRP subunit Pop8-like domain-containing protein n=1 Tax=Elsinoe australis TaxID=40998 RepID=A0A4U7ASP7_9PEZI|nr:hypothetical protein C1H76_8360 [Elsinoe australis]